MHSQTLQALRAEIEAITTLQLALNRIALTVDDNSLSVWDGPRPEDVDDIAADDGSFTRESVMEVRARAGEALARRYAEVERVIMGRAALESLVRSTLSIGTGGVITAEGPPPSQVLGALARSGALRLDWAQEASAQVRDVLESKEGPAVTRPTAPATPKAKSGGKAKVAKTTAKKAKTVAKVVARAVKKVVKKVVATAAKKVKTVKAAKAAKAEAKASKKKKPAPAKKPAAKKKK
ncbi:MAG: hypothetical protein Q8N23_04190 [Archangium sp.]|nr:hypothetical protein [Archangium sp.]MDP3569886.1 hypothetical protein [Archangium sp.]